jgi:hypothetical protein
MTKTTLALIALSLLAAATPFAQEQMRPADHDSLGKAIAEYIEARNKNQGIDKAQEAIAAELEKVKKRLKTTRDPLAMSADLGKALWSSSSYATARGVKKGKVATTAIPAPYADEDSKKTIEYAISAPARYDPKRAYPLLLCVPERGQKPQDHLGDQWTLAAIKENAILVAAPMPEDPALWSEGGGPEAPGGIAHLLTVFGAVARTYAIDFDRIYLCGRGEGVAAAVTIASRFPDRFAGVIGRSGDVGETGADNFRNLPTFFAGAGAGATAFQGKIDAAGYGNCTVKPDGSEEDIWAWIEKNPRVSNPAEVVLVPGSPFPIRAYWLEVPALDTQGGARITGKIDRATNTVTVDAEGIASTTLYFNDQLVDLDKPVKVVCNGSENVALIPRNLPLTLQLMYQSRSDPGKVYTANKTFDVPAKPKTK